MFTSALIGLKPGGVTEPLTALATGVLRSGARVHLVALVRVGKEDDERARLSETETWLDGVAGPLTEQGYDVECHTQITVSAGSDLVRMAETLDVELIVMGLGARSRVGKALIGSDAQRVLLSTDRAVLCQRVE